jgi:hypothetical protein
VDFFIPFVKGEIKSNGHIYTPKELDIIERHRYWKQATHFGDPDVGKRSYGANKISAKDTLANEGIYVQTHYRDESGHLAIKERTRLLFRRLEVNQERCEYFLDAIRNARYPQRQESSQSTTPITKPIHDWTSHFRTALEYFVDNEPSREKIGAVITKETNNDPINPSIVNGFIEEARARKAEDWRYQ